MSRKYFPGQKYGYLTTISFHHKQNHNRYWLFKCDCGNETIQQIGNVANGRIKSCGCYHRLESAHRAKVQFTKHGYAKKERLYSIWKSMKTRCYNPKSKSYKDYGGRGIIVCADWKDDFSAFRTWAMANGYADNLTIDRINVDGNYEPSNCRWENDMSQANNKKNTKRYTYNGQSKTISEWALLYRFPRKTLNDRLKNGWNIEKALTQPIKKQCG